MDWDDQPEADLRLSPRACAKPAGRFRHGATRGKRLRQRQAVLAIVGDDGARLAGAANGQLRSPLRALRLRHDLVAELIETDTAGGGDGSRDIGRGDFVFRWW